MKRRPRHLKPTLWVSLFLTAALFLMPLVLSLRGGGVEEQVVPDTAEDASGGADRDEASGRTDSPATDSAPDHPTDSGETEILIPDDARDGAVQLRVLDGETVREMDMGTYLAGVLRGEMPASFEPEALRAQAVAARTYTRHMLLDGGKHGGVADICTDSTCCQAYRGESEARKGWGKQADEYESRIEAAVADTDGQVLLYGGAPILAVFHSSSPGLTQEVGQVWGGDLPYLKAVSSPETGDTVPNYYSRAEFTANEFRQRVHASYPDADLSGPMEGWLTDADRNDAGTVETLRVGGVLMRGAQLRTALDLRSACFTWEVQGNKLVFFVTAHGHGVGLSQYGANLMAQGGADYREILTHYYTGVTIGPYED